MNNLNPEASVSSNNNGDNNNQVNNEKHNRVFVFLKKNQTIIMIVFFVGLLIVMIVAYVMLTKKIQDLEQSLNYNTKCMNTLLEQNAEQLKEFKTTMAKSVSDLETVHGNILRVFRGLNQDLVLTKDTLVKFETLFEQVTKVVVKRYRASSPFF